jgi:hypothetical protein
VTFYVTFLLTVLRVRAYTERVFAIKPPTAEQEFEELHALLGTAVLAEVLGKRPESVSRLKARKRYTRPVERLIDDVWTVVHVAVGQGEVEPDAVRGFLLLRRPELGQRPAAELIRGGETDTVLALIAATHPDSDHISGLGDVVSSGVVPGGRRRRPAADPAARAAAQRRLADRGLAGLDRERLVAAGREAWGAATPSDT